MVESREFKLKFIEKCLRCARKALFVLPFSSTAVSTKEKQLNLLFHGIKLLEYLLLSVELKDCC